MAPISIPADRANRHGGEEFLQGGAKYAETFEVWGGLKPSDRVLDIGCGPGRMAIGIGERFGWTNTLIGFDVIKIDVDVCSHAITSAHPGFRFVHVDAWNGHYNPNGRILPDEVVFPAKSGTIEFCFATSVFTHMFRKEIARYLSETYRILAPGGHALTSWFSITDAAEESCRAGRARFRFDHSQDDGSFVENLAHPEDVVGYRHTDILTLFAEAGFSRVSFHQGAWSRTGLRVPKPRHSQDVFVCSKD